MKSLPSSVIRTETSLVRSRLPLPQLPRTWDAERSSALSSRPVTLFPPKTSGPPAGSTATVSQPLPTAVVGKTRPGTPGKGISLGAKYGSGTASDGRPLHDSRPSGHSDESGQFRPSGNTDHHAR